MKPTACFASWPERIRQTAEAFEQAWAAGIKDPDLRVPRFAFYEAIRQEYPQGTSREFSEQLIAYMTSRGFPPKRLGG